MVFSSPRFLTFLVVLLAILAIRSFEVTTRKRILLVASCLFYAAWDVRYLGLLALVSVIDYVVANRIRDSREEGARRAWLLVSIVSNLGILAYFKYCDFFLENANQVLGPLLGASIPLMRVLLPAGISFYTFKTMSYTIDVYRGTLEPERSLIDYATFVTFFPELIAGPIVRASVFLPQLGREVRPTWERLRTGGSIFLLGLTKKLLIADQMAKVADPMFANHDLYSGTSLWIGVVAYTIQIYGDFSGYSDMAIGTAKMLGYDLPRNFNMPYLSPDITEFWRRWHITLSSWLRDYLYIPLGGNRKGPWRTYLNLAITMILGGLWHGASWNFVLWGALHGVALALHKLFRERSGGRPVLPAAISTPLTLLFVMLAWVPFRATSFATTASMLRRMFTLDPHGTTFLPTAMIPALGLMIAGHALGVLFAKAEDAGDEPAKARARALLRPFGFELASDRTAGFYVRLSAATVAGAFIVFSWLLAIFFFAPTNTSPFIYFQF